MPLTPAELTSTHFARDHVTMRLDIREPGTAPESVAAELIELVDLLEQLVRPWRATTFDAGDHAAWFKLARVVSLPPESPRRSAQLVVDSLELDTGRLVVGDLLGLGDGQRLDLLPGRYDVTLVAEDERKISLVLEPSARAPHSYCRLDGWGSDVGIMAITGEDAGQIAAQHAAISRHNPLHPTLADRMQESIRPGLAGVVRLRRTDQPIFVGGLVEPGPAELWLGTNRAGQAMGLKIQLVP
ncbi:MAG: hypothetical protein HKN26_16330 [Acidimicrobiales bacterium]|nr:hypothetical protein [Acidimicrobiales bacterium]